MKTSRSLAARLSLLQQLATITVFAIFAASSLWITQRTLKRDERVFLKVNAERLADNIDREAREEGDLARAATEVLQEETDTNLQIVLHDPSGRFLAASERGAPDRAGGHTAHVSVTSPRGVRVTVSTSTGPREASMRVLERTVFLTALPLLVVTLMISRLITRRALRPLDEMGQRARDAASAQGTRSLGTAEGISEIDGLRDAFNRLLERLDDLLQSERRFTADASHELRTPLTVLSGELEAALARPDLPADARPGMERAAAQVRTMIELVEALLLMRRAGPEGTISARDGEVINLADLAREVTRQAEEREPARTPDIRLEAPDEILVFGQQTLLAAALRNLLDNALKFTQAGQALSITVIAAADASGRAAVCIDDAGPGIPLSERERVFDPFYRGAEARAERAGHGLGLPILRQVARAHGGEVTIDASPLGGAQVTLYVPSLIADVTPRRPAT